MGWRLPMTFESASRLRITRTGRLCLLAASAAGTAKKPWPNWANDYGPGWLYRPFGGRAPDPLKTNEIKNIEEGLYYFYIRNRQTYNCPLDKTNSITWQKRAQRVSSYIMNGAVCAFGRYNSGKTYKITAFNPVAYVHWEPEIQNFGG